MRWLPCTLLALGLAATAGALPRRGSTTIETLETARGPVQLSETTPMSPPGKVPFLLVLPSQGMDRNGRLFVALAARAARLGYLVVRMDWGFRHRRGGVPAPDLGQEIGEVNAVLDHYLADERVDPQRVVLAAKGLGARVALGGPYTRARALLVLTPNCDREGGFASTFGALLAGSRPAHIVLPAADSRCPIEEVYGALGKAGPHLTIHTVGGDHDFEVEGDPRRRDVEAAIRGAEAWLATKAVGPLR